MFGINFGDIDVWRKGHMAMAEAIDAWRLIPRALTFGFGLLMWKLAMWYTQLETKMVEGCDVQLLKEACVSVAPNTQHAVILTVVVGAATAIFGLYTSSGKKWNGFTPWNKAKPAEEKPTETA